MRETGRVVRPPHHTATVEQPMLVETVELADDMTRAYIAYARETITDRALPDVRDGLKPVQRRILYGMYDLGLRHDQPHKKCARIVGEVLGKYHPHGDSSVYLALVRMAQDFVMGVPLVDGQGNFGSIDGDAPAAMRYTEARLTAAAETMLQDLNMNTVEWTDNFDGSLKEPTVLPTVLPNLLVNGVDGIAVGMATRMPPHNLGEVCDAIIHVARNWQRREEITVDELMQFIPGPDFPTGGIVYRYRDEGNGTGPIDTIRQAYETGRGRIVMQARLTVEDIGGGKANIVVTELPYGVLKSTVMEKIAKEVREGRITGVTDLRDESDHRGMRLVIEVSRQSNAQEVLQQLVKYSQLRETFGVINLALVPSGPGGRTRPAYLPLRDLLTYFIAHRLEVIERRSRYELEQRRARLHIVEGLLKALDVLDEVIETIRRSQTAETAKANLMRKFGFTDPQATAILDMQLRRLAALERKRLDEERRELKTRIRYLEELLASEAKRLEVVVEETAALKTRFATPRRTVIMHTEQTVATPGAVTTEADLRMPEGTQTLLLLPDGIRRVTATGFSLRVSRKPTKRPASETVLLCLDAEPNDQVLLFSRRGLAWKGAVGFVPGQADFRDLGLERSDSLVGMAVLNPEWYLILATRSGRIKRTRVSDLALPDRSWGPAIGLAETDELLFGTVAPPGSHVIFYTLQGQLLRLDGDTIHPQATGTAMGVAGIALKAEDHLLGGFVVPNAVAEEAEWQIVIASQSGYLHRVPLSQFPVQGRNTQGVRCLRPSKSGGWLAAATAAKTGLLDVYLSDGRAQTIDFKNIPETTRDALGKQLVETGPNAIVRAIVTRSH